MKKTYITPEIGVKRMNTESPLLVDSPTKQVTNVTGSDLGYGGGGGNSPARGSDNNIWDDSDNDSDWDGL